MLRLMLASSSYEYPRIGLKAPVSASPAFGNAAACWPPRPPPPGWPPRPPRPPAGGGAAAECGPHQPPGAPRLHVFQLLRKSVRVGRRIESFFPQNRRYLVMPVPVAGRAAEHQNDHVRPVSPDHPHHIRENAVMAPFFQGLRRRLGKTEVDRARKELFRPIDLASRQQFLGADDPHLRSLLRADQILPASI